MNPFVFIVGCPRSGTTLLQRVVNAHPQLAIINQSRWIPGFFKKRTGLTADGLVTPALIDHLLTFPKFRKLRLGRSQLESLLGNGEPVSYADFVRRFFDLYGQVQGKALVGDKTPIYVRKIRLLHELWPKARFVHLIRDGRDVGLSTINWQKKTAKLSSHFSTWSEDAVTTAGVRWQWNVRLGREAGQPLGPDLYYELRYEALVTRPAETCAGLCDFLGLPYDDAMLRFHEGRTKSRPGLDAKHAWRPITPGLRDWRTQMAAVDLERFEAAAGDLLEELGYERAVAQPRPEALRQAARVRAALIEDVRGTGEGVFPAPWSTPGGRA